MGPTFFSIAVVRTNLILNLRNKQFVNQLIYKKNILYTIVNYL
jgi:hypothetical protein